MPVFDKQRKIRMWKWVIFTVVFGVAPLFATYAVSDDDFSLRMIVGHGELFLIAAVLMGDGVARVANANAMSDVFGIICLGALVLILASASLEFGNASKDLIKGKVITDRHLWLSISIFLASIIAGIGAVILEE